MAQERKDPVKAVHAVKIDRKMVEHIAHLARLELNNEEKEEFSAQLDKILQYIDKLNELDLSNIEPTFHIFPLKNILREDVVRQSLSREEILSNAPEQEKGHFKVPRIIE